METQEEPVRNRQRKVIERERESSLRGWSEGEVRVHMKRAKEKRSGSRGFPKWAGRGGPKNRREADGEGTGSSSGDDNRKEKKKKKTRARE